MTDVEQPDWQRRRSDFNHQWLKNRLLSALDAAGQVIRGRIKSTASLQELLDEELPEWRERREDLRALLDDFEREMSPRRLFDDPPLSRCHPAAREVLAELMHQLWLARYPIAEWLASGRAAAARVDVHYERLRASAPIDEMGRVRGEFASHFVEFLNACRALSKVLERFPNRILVT